MDKKKLINYGEFALIKYIALLSKEMNIWKDCDQVPLTSLLSFIVDNRGKTVPLIDDKNGIKLIATNCIKNESLYPVYEKVRFLSEETYKTWFRAHPRPGDIIFVNKGTPGKVAFVPDPIDFCIAQDMMAFRVNPEIVYNKYLFAVLRSAKIQEQIRITSVGDVIPHFKKEFLDEIKIPLSDMKIQKYLGDMYFMYSEKIELNNKINTNLERQAGALFKNWFVDFEPFGGKMPEGWKVGKLSEIADYLNGLAMQKFRPLEDEEGLPVLKIKELRQGCCDESSELCSPSKVKPEYIIHDGDVIFSWSGSLLVDIWCGGICGLNQHLFKVTSKTYEKWFYYLWTKHHLDRFIFLAADKATTMGHIKREELDKAEVVIPDDKTYSKLTMTLSPIIDTITNNRVENRRLSEIRDNLLPELMSGNINVEDITI